MGPKNFVDLEFSSDQKKILAGAEKNFGTNKFMARQTFWDLKICLHQKIFRPKIFFSKNSINALGQLDQVTRSGSTLPQLLAELGPAQPQLVDDTNPNPQSQCLIPIPSPKP